MQDSKLSRYVDLDIEDTLSPRPENRARPLGNGPAPAGAIQDASAPGTLTPINVLKRIRDDIVRTLGLHPDPKGSFSKLEETLIQYLEKILRKGSSPSCLALRRETLEALFCLKKYYGKERVRMHMDPGGREGPAVEVLVFHALYQYARDAAFCDQKIKEIRASGSAAQTWEERESQRVETLKLKKRRDRAVTYYQKIIFTDGERLRMAQSRRSLMLFGKKATLEDLINYLKTGGAKPRSKGESQLDTSMTFSAARAPKQQEAPSPEEVVDWRSVNKAAHSPGERSRQSPFKFNI